jgi:hypothetical protein
MGKHATLDALTDAYHCRGDVNVGPRKGGERRISMIGSEWRASVGDNYGVAEIIVRDSNEKVISRGNANGSPGSGFSKVMKAPVKIRVTVQLYVDGEYRCSKHGTNF